MSTNSEFARQDSSVSTQYDTWARVYDVLWRRYMNRTLPVVQHTADVQSGERVLDVACGTGDLLRRFAEARPEAELTGVDLAAGMVERARQKLADVSDVSVQQADAHALPFSDDTVDVVVSSSTFHYFTHPRAVLAEMRRVLRPDGRLILLDWCRDYWTCRVMDSVLQYVDPAHGTCYTLDELAGHLDATGWGRHSSFRYRFDLVWGMMVVDARPAPQS